MGLIYNGTIIAGEGDNVRLNLYGGNVYEADHGILTGNSNPHTLAMEGYNTIISAFSTLPYSTDFETACDWHGPQEDLTNAWTWGTAAHNGSGTN